MRLAPRLAPLLVPAALAVSTLARADEPQQPSSPPPPPPYGYGYGPPPGYVYVPPPPLRPAPHLSPRVALWVGLRAGYELPLGSAYVDGNSSRLSERDLVGPGPTLEVNVGARLGRRFLPFVYFSHDFSSKGSAAGPPPSTSLLGVAVVTPPAHPDARPGSSTTNLLGFGFRYSFSPDDVGFVAEIAYAYRWTQATYSDGTVLRAGAPGELRLGLGAEIRLSPVFSFSPLLVFAAGSYTDVTVQAPGGREQNALANGETHGYFGLQIGGHFNLFGKYD